MMHAQSMRSARLWALCLFLVAGTAGALPRFDEEFEDEQKPWEEIAVQLPPAPVADNLLPFYVSPTATQQFAVDAKSLTVDTDDVVRYTLVTKSPEGATNISYEGIRCLTGEKKLYAFGRPDGSWSRSRRNEWMPVTGRMVSAHHAILAREYFCQEGTVAGSARDILQRLRYQRPISASRIKQ